MTTQSTNVPAVGAVVNTQFRYVRAESAGLTAVEMKIEFHIVPLVVPRSAMCPPLENVQFTTAFAVSMYPLFVKPLKVQS